MEEILNHIGWHADAMIFNANLDKITVNGGADFDGAAIVAVFDCVVDQITHYFTDAVEVSSNGWQSIRELNANKRCCAVARSCISSAIVS